MIAVILITLILTAGMLAIAVRARGDSLWVKIARRRVRAEAGIWFHKTRRRVDGAILRSQIKREGLRLRRELRHDMDEHS